MTFRNGQKYVGSFINRESEGNGKHIWPDGEEHDGEWKNDKKHGIGMHTYPDGRKQKERWENDRLVEVLQILN